MADKFTKPCKKIQTYNSYQQSNGWLLEIMSDQDRWTEHLKGQIYLTVVAPHNQKGFHIHARAMYHFTCLRGRVKSIIYSKPVQKRVMEMGDGNFQTIKVFPGEAHCMINDSDDEAYLLTYRYPAWTADDPDILTISPSEIETPQAWEKIDYFNKFIKT